MKIIVDEMPMCMDDCPFCEMQWDGGQYVGYCKLHYNNKCEYFNNSDTRTCFKLMPLEEVSLNNIYDVFRIKLLAEFSNYFITKEDLDT